MSVINVVEYSVQVHGSVNLRRLDEMHRIINLNIPKWKSYPRASHDQPMDWMSYANEAWSLWNSLQPAYVLAALLGQL